MSLRWWAVYRSGQYIGHVRAVSGERALDMMSDPPRLPLAELQVFLDDPRGINPMHQPEMVSDAGETHGDMLGQFDHDRLERSGLGLLPFFSMEIGPEFSEPGPTMQSVPWSQASERVAAQRETDPIPDAGPTDADLLGEVV